LLDLLGEPVAPVGEPVELLGELGDDLAGGLLGRDGDGLGGERGLDLVDQPGAQPWRLALREWSEPAPRRGAQRGRRRIALRQRPADGMVEPGAEHPLQRRTDRQQHVARPVRGAGSRGAPRSSSWPPSTRRRSGVSSETSSHGSETAREVRQAGRTNPGES